MSDVVVTKGWGRQVESMPIRIKRPEIYPEYRVSCIYQHIAISRTRQDFR